MNCIINLFSGYSKIFVRGTGACWSPYYKIWEEPALLSVVEEKFLHLHNGIAKLSLSDVTGFDEYVQIYFSIGLAKIRIFQNENSLTTYSAFI